jgi:DNA-binding transcriptional MerR regulator
MTEPAAAATLLPLDEQRRPQKAASAFRTISEVAEDLGVAQHVLRFWESRFSQVRPLKRAGGRRYYRPEDVELLRRIKALLYDQGFTIKGAQKALRARRDRDEAPAAPADAAPRAGRDRRPLPAELRTRLGEVLEELKAAREELARVHHGTISGTAGK